MRAGMRLPSNSSSIFSKLVISFDPLVFLFEGATSVTISVILSVLPTIIYGKTLKRFQTGSGLILYVLLVSFTIVR